MAPALAHVRRRHKVALATLASIVSVISPGGNLIFEAGVGPLTSPQPGHPLCSRICGAEGAPLQSVEKKVVEQEDEADIEDDEDDDYEDRETLRLSRRPKRSVRSLKTTARRNVLQHPAAAAALGLTLMLVGVSVGAGVMSVLQRRQQKEKPVVDPNIKEAVKVLDPAQMQKVVVDKGAIQEGDSLRQLKAALNIVAGTLVSGFVLRLMSAYKAPFMYTSMLDAGTRAVLQNLTASSPLMTTVQHALLAMGSSALTQYFGIMYFLAVPLALIAMQQLGTRWFKAVPTKDREKLGDLFVFTAHHMKHALQREAKDDIEGKEAVVKRYFRTMKKEAIQRKLYDRGAEKALLRAQADLISEIKKKKEVEDCLEYAQMQFMNYIGVKFSSKQSLP
ncbi:hypothetical protein BESB_013980 [Besnoitia besnoiti]|uniref:Transmembrane protein n=1 Tax=Besnoitia besnoiti TaxID=94643 RepID=A0A2A9MA24_BESBE|nr:hypothetical protein BESB_013980 [Besnoitia besnoiti]PFH32786.1 hypothetical protein BESB_013980 [Besnoitia besnoiti]